MDDTAAWELRNVLFYSRMYSPGKRLSSTVFEFSMLNIDFVKENYRGTMTVNVLTWLHNSFILSRLPTAKVVSASPWAW
jgi:hypothetical protein